MSLPVLGFACVFARVSDTIRPAHYDRHYLTQTRSPPFCHGMPGHYLRSENLVGVGLPIVPDVPMVLAKVAPMVFGANGMFGTVHDNSPSLLA